MDNWEYESAKKKKKVNDDTIKNEDFRINGSIKEGNIYSEDNHIYFYSEVSKKTVFELNKEIRMVTQKMKDIGNKYSIDPPIIYLHINSFGGSIFAAMSSVDIIKYNSVPIYTIIEGCAASAATLMSVVGKKRFMRPKAHMLIHQLSTIFWGKMDEFDDEMKNLNILMNLIKNIYKEHTSVPVKKLNEILKHDLWWDYDKCLNYNLVDDMIKSV